MADLIEVNVDISDVLDGLETLEGELNYIGRRLVQKVLTRVETQAKNILLRVYDTAVAEAGEQFPAIYANHLRQGLQQLNFAVDAVDSEIVVSFQDIEELGDWIDILNAVHYHAILDVSGDEFSVSNPPYSAIGEDIEALYGPNHVDNRQNFWDALIVGADYTITFGKEGVTPVWVGAISTAGMYEETLNARVQYWGNRYPEWIILDEGMDGIPGSPPTHFVSLIGPAIEEFILGLIEPQIEPTVDEAVATWDEKVKRYRGPSGRFIKGPR